MASIDDPVVPEGCENFGTIDAQFDDCNEVYVFGPFDGLLVGQAPLTADPKTTAGLTAATTEITERLGLPDSDPLAMRLLRPLRGNMPAITPTLITVDGKQIPTPTLRNLPFTISQLNDKNYEFIRTLNGGRSGNYWPLHKSYMYGGKNGVGDGTASLQMSNIVPEGEDGLHTGTGNLSYTSLYDPARTPSPI